MKKLELLAPAKNLNTALSAINCGADAVYIGASAFGARINAINNLEDIEKLINYAHLFNVKVYVTLNTILDDDEIERAIELIKKLYEIKVDALIVQDFSIFYLSSLNKIPPIVLHASTQCDIRTLEKVKFFENLNLKRVILARELNIEKIKEISKNTTLELEHFVSGALCVSYSGQCYLSQFIGQRSANRGCCAQACRKKYSLLDKKGNYLIKNSYLLSLKDNNLSKHLNKLIEAGIISFKIEGRLKDENYVKNSVLYYHKLLENYPRVSNGKIFSNFIPNLSKTFNRGFCDDYLFSKKDNIYNFISPKSIGEFIGTISSKNNNNFVIKLKNKNEQINSQDGLCFITNNELQGCLVNKAEKVKEGIKIYPNKELKLKVGEKIYRNIDIKFNKELENSKIIRKLEAKIVVEKNNLSIFDENNNKVTLEYDFEQLANNQEKMKENYKKALLKTQDTPFLIKEIVFNTKELGFLPISKINELRRELIEKLSNLILSRYKVKKQKQIEPTKFPQNKGDYKLNCHNKMAKEFYELCGCEVAENSFEKLEKIQIKNKSYELMRTKHCLRRASLGCNSKEELFLEDEKGYKYPLLFDCKNCEMVILNK